MSSEARCLPRVFLLLPWSPQRSMQAALIRFM